MKTASRFVLVAGLFAALAMAPRVQAQVCFGTPSQSSLSADIGKVSFGKSYGGTGTLTSNHLAFSIGIHDVEIGPQSSGYDGDLRFAVQIGAARVRICPAISLAFNQQKWTPSLGELTSRYFTGGAGLGIGFEQPIWRKVSVIPFGAVRYTFSVITYDFSAPDADASMSGDTLSHAEMQYGLLARYNMLYAGFAGQRAFKASNPSAVRWMLGVTFPMPIKKE